ncbi:hypothetical protein ACISSW_29035, partial [Escherichia coli]
MKPAPWNKGRFIRQKRPLQISHIWGTRIRLELEGKTRDLALFNMAQDSKLRGCDLANTNDSSVAYVSWVPKKQRGGNKKTEPRCNLKKKKKKKKELR